MKISKGRKESLPGFKIYYEELVGFMDRQLYGSAGEKCVLAAHLTDLWQRRKTVYQRNAFEQ